MPRTAGPPLDPITAISAGWQAFLANPWMSLGVCFVLFAVAFVGQMIPFVNILFSLLVMPALYAGGAWFFLRGIRGENPTFETAFEGFQRWPAVTGAILLVMVVAIVIMTPVIVVILATVGFAALSASRTGPMPELSLPLVAALIVTYPVLAWWSARSYMVLFVVMEADRPGPIEALKRSFALTSGSVWRLIGLFLLWIPVSLLGLLALCVGVIPAAIVTYYSYAHAYEQLRRRAGG
jgi:uncharacterized membrane protein